MTNAHTPGPWHFRTVTNERGRASAIILETKHRPVPCNDPAILPCARIG
jgi:hypothetical protein